MTIKKKKKKKTEKKERKKEETSKEKKILSSIKTEKHPNPQKALISGKMSTFSLCEHVAVRKL